MHQTRWHRIFAPLVWLALVQVFAMSLIAASPELHEHLHEDSHGSHHHCLSTDLGAGTIYQTTIAPIVTPVCTTLHIDPVRVTTVSRCWLPVHLCGSLLAHGPPAFAL